MRRSSTGLENGQGTTGFMRRTSTCPELTDSMPDQRWFHTQALRKMWTQSMPPTPDTSDVFGSSFGCKPGSEEEKMIASELNVIYERLMLEDDDLASAMKFSWTVDHSQEPEAIFRRLDVDGNGCLTLAELREGLKDHGLPDRQLTEIFNELDVDGDDGVSLDEFCARFSVWQQRVLVHPGVHMADMVLDSGLSTIRSFDGLANAGEKSMSKMSAFLHQALELHPYHVRSLLRAAALRLRILHLDEAARLLGRAAAVEGSHGVFVLGAIQAVRKAEEYQKDWDADETLKIEGVDFLQPSLVVDRGLPDEIALEKVIAAALEAERKAAEQKAAEIEAAEAAVRAAAEAAAVEQAAAEAEEAAALEAEANVELLLLLRDAIAESAAEVVELTTSLQESAAANAAEVTLLHNQLEAHQDEIASMKAKAKAKGSPKKSKYDIPSTPAMQDLYATLSPSQLLALEEAD